MNNRTTLAPILQSVLPKEELEPMIQSLGYVDTARKFTVYDLFLFLAEAAIQKWDGYRDGEQRMTGCGLRKVDHSTISKKAKDVPFELFKQFLQRLIQKCNRPTRRRLRIPKELLLVDSTTITVGRNRLPWAPMKGERSGVKLHVSLLADEGKLHQVTESIGREHDLPFCQDVTDSQFILVADRAYGKHKQFDAYMEAGRAPVLCNPATGQYDFASTHPERTQTPIQRHDRARRDVPIGKQSHADPTSISGREIEGSSRSSCCPCNQSAQAIGRTYCRNLSATVAVFFRWIKQHLNVPKLFGTTPNAVYGQLYSALVVYVLLQFLYVQGNQLVHPSARISFADFARLMNEANLPIEWIVYLANHVAFP